MQQITGGCLCGEVRYNANVEPAFIGLCHCRNCQKESGSAFAIVVGVPQAALSLQGELRTFTTRATAARQCSAGSARIAAPASSMRRR